MLFQPSGSIHQYGKDFHPERTLQGVQIIVVLVVSGVPDT